MAKTILIVDDDPTQRRLMQVVCEKAGYFTMQADDGQKAVDILASPEGAAVSLMMLDLIMPNMGGMETLEYVRKTRADLPIVMLTAQGGIDTVVEAMQKGAADFFVKPASPERVVVSINNALNLTQLKGEVSRLQRKQQNATNFNGRYWRQPCLETGNFHGREGSKIQYSDIDHWRVRFRQGNDCPRYSRIF